VKYDGNGSIYQSKYLLAVMTWHAVNSEKNKRYNIRDGNTRMCITPDGLLV
jgi:hypothetical protein